MRFAERYPSIKTLAEAFGKEKARAIRAAMEGPGGGCTRLEKVDAILGSYGVEYIGHGNNEKSPAIYYCNMGDPYSTTVLRVNCSFRVGCWGDIVERGNYD